MISEYARAMNEISDRRTVNTLDLFKIVGSWEEIQRMNDYGYIDHDEKWRWHVTHGGMTAIGGKK